MAKKKQKQNNHSSKKGSNKHKDSPRSRLECSARESYRERTICIRHDETLTPELREGIDKNNSVGYKDESIFGYHQSRPFLPDCTDL